MLSEVEYFQEKQQKVTDSKIFNLKQMPKRLPIALAQVKAGNTSENLLNKIKTNHIFFVSSIRKH